MKPARNHSFPHQLINSDYKGPVLDSVPGDVDCGSKDNQDKENALGTIISLGIVIWLIYQIPGCFSYDCHDEAVKVRMCTYELDDYVNHNEKGLKKYKECVKMYRKWENKCVSKEKREKYKALDDNFFFLK